jgi:hypothetical protein
VIWLQDWLESGNAVLLMIAIILVEIAVLGFAYKSRSRPIIVGLIPGLCLMMALRAAMTGQGAEWIGLWLTASLPAHLIDLYGRTRAAGRD